MPVAVTLVVNMNVISRPFVQRQSDALALAFSNVRLPAQLFPAAIDQVTFDMGSIINVPDINLVFSCRSRYKFEIVVVENIVIGPAAGGPGDRCRRNDIVSGIYRYPHPYFPVLSERTGRRPSADRMDEPVRLALRADHDPPPA